MTNLLKKIINFVYIAQKLKHIKILVCNACYNFALKINL